MANYTLEIKTMLEKVILKFMEYERKGFSIESTQATISFSEWIFIKHVGNSEEPSISNISKSLSMDRGLITTYMNKFLRNNILTKIKSEEDKRYSVLKLTSLGEKLYEEMTVKEEEVLGFLLGDLTINEEKGILKILSKIAQLTVTKRRLKDGVSK